MLSDIERKLSNMIDDLRKYRPVLVTFEYQVWDMSSSCDRMRCMSLNNLFILVLQRCVETLNMA